MAANSLAACLQRVPHSAGRAHVGRHLDRDRALYPKFAGQLAGHRQLDRRSGRFPESCHDHSRLDSAFSFVGMDLSFDLFRRIACRAEFCDPQSTELAHRQRRSAGFFVARPCSNRHCHSRLDALCDERARDKGQMALDFGWRPALDQIVVATGPPHMVGHLARGQPLSSCVARAADLGSARGTKPAIRPRLADLGVGARRSFGLARRRGRVRGFSDAGDRAVSGDRRTTVTSFGRAGRSRRSTFVHAGNLHCPGLGPARLLIGRSCFPWIAQLRFLG